jgi:hypothetical protein
MIAGDNLKTTRNIAVTPLLANAYQFISSKSKHEISRRVDEIACNDDEIWPFRAIQHAAHVAPQRWVEHCTEVKIGKVKDF